MASTTGNGHGGRRQNSGRKRKFGDGKDRKEAKKEWHRCHKRIYLEKDIFQSWLQVKYITGFEARSDSAFAAHLLSQEVRRTSSIDVSNVLQSSNFHNRRKASNPRKHVIKQSAEGEGSTQLISVKSSDRPAVNEPTIAGLDTQGSQLPSISSADSTSVEGSSDPTNLTAPHEKTNNCTTLGKQHNSSQMHDTGTIEIQLLFQQ